MDDDFGIDSLDENFDDRFDKALHALTEDSASESNLYTVFDDFIAQGAGADNYKEILAKLRHYPKYHRYLIDLCAEKKQMEADLAFLIPE